MSLHPLNRAVPRSGFTLVELVIVVTIIIALAGIVTPRLTSVSEKAKFARAASEMRGIKTALDMLYADIGFYPDDVGEGDPGLSDPTAVPADRLDDWRGPYLDTWPTENPWGGTYEYEYWTSSTFNFDGTAGNEVFVRIRSGMDTATMTRLDGIIDDGDTTTGLAQISGNGLLLYIGEGPDW